MSSVSNTGSRPARILIANDQEWTARSLESILAPEGYEVVRAYTGRQAIERALDSRPDLIILDTQLPDLSGPEVCRRLRSDPAIGWHVPVVLTTAGSNGRTRLMEALEAGAWDFAPQPFDGPALLTRIRTFLNAKAAFDRAQASATIDAATGLCNSRGLAQRASELLSGARRRNEPLTCVVVSADGPGVQAASEIVDHAAATIADALRSAVRGSDTLARMSALDFAIIAPNLDRELAVRVIERFRLHLARLNPEGGIAVRAGLATLDPAACQDPDALLQLARSAADVLAPEPPVPTA